MGADDAGERGALEDVQHVMRGDAGVGAELRQQVQRHQQFFPGPGARPVGDAVDVEQRVVDVLARRRWRGCRAWSRAWWSRSPPRRLAVPARGAWITGKRTQIVVLVWSWYSISASASAVFSTGDHITGRRPRYSAPFSRNLQISCGDRRFGRVVHGGVAVGEIALHAEAAELLRLHVHPVRGVGAAFGAEIQHRDGVLVLAGLAVVAPRSATRSAGRGSPSRGCSWRRSRPSGGCG